ncbi:MAG: ketopantoate reductase family protein [Deltaproteobacteria bacterium]|nr:ketopantoate reductase family protein [Deltaproteobacteria bacterium]
MKIVIIGAGAMGSVFGAKISEVADTLLINPENPHTDAVIKNSLIIEDPEGIKKKFKVKLICDYKTVTDKFDAAIILTKSYKTKEASYAAKKLLKNNGIALTLQNGIGNIEIISSIIGEDKTVAGVTAHGATLVSAGYVRHAGVGDTYLAKKPNKKNLIENLIQIFEKAGIKVLISDNINSIIWGKLIINVGINAIAAILKTKNGIIGDMPESFKIVKNAAEEAVEIAKAIKITLPFDDPIKQVKTVCQKTANNRASMLQDITNRKKTEIEFINGAIVDYGKKLNIQTPYNKILTEIIQASEAAYNNKKT